MAPKVRIKDIAEKSGVSVGTVDRILHNRPNVSKVAREKVEKVLKEINYQPNVYASALAYNKSYNFHIIMPRHDRETYWEEIEEGAMKACDARRDFHIDVTIHRYERFNTKDYSKNFQELLDASPSGVVIVPSELEVTKKFTDILHDRDIPFILLDSYMPDLRPLSFYGQDSFSSGYFAARMLMLLAHDDKEIMLMKQTKNGQVASKQQANREVGFRHYMRDHFPSVTIHELDLPLDKSHDENDATLEAFFKKHTNVHHCVTLSARAHVVGEFLLRTNRRNIQIMGYDLVGKNVECVKQGSISFLISQHAFMQGYLCVDALFHAIVLKKKVKPVNYMPIELLTKENIEFYKRESV
jgi:LacI family transcriptional regulator